MLDDPRRFSTFGVPSPPLVFLHLLVFLSDRPVLRASPPSGPESSGPGKSEN